MLYAILTINSANKIDCRGVTQIGSWAMKLSKIWSQDMFTLVVELNDGDTLTIDRCDTDTFKILSKHNITLNLAPQKE